MRFLGHRTEFQRSLGAAANGLVQVLRSDRWITALPIVFLTTLFWRWDLSRLSFFLLALVGLARIALESSRPVICKEERRLFVSGLSYLAVGVASYFVNGMPSHPPYDPGSQFLPRYAFFIFAAPIFILFRQLRLSQSHILLLFTLGTAAAGLAAIVQLWFPEISGLWGVLDDFHHSPRVGANTNPIQFGSMTLCMLLGVLVQAQHVTKWSWYGITWTILCAMVGILAVLHSGTRGVWAAVPVVLVVLLIIRWRQVKPWARGVYIVLLISPLLAYQSPLVKQRVDSAVTETQMYLVSDDPRDHARVTSTGVRLEMWRAAWDMFKRHPVLGVGPGGYNQAVTEMVMTGEWSPALGPFGSPHNEYLGALAMRGLLGLVTVALVIGLPAWSFYSRARVPLDDNTDLGLAGLLTMVSFAIYGLTSNPLEQENEAMFFAFLVALILGTIRGRELARSQEAGDTPSSSPHV